ncbi:MAG: FAD-binding oxidoreductase, partial [Syntrophothermus sp.]
MLTGSYGKLYDYLIQHIPAGRIFTDRLRRLAYGTDASFYRMTPELVVKAESEDEIIMLISKCRELNLPLTFRAAGTSLSGQAISDS